MQRIIDEEGALVIYYPDWLEYHQQAYDTALNLNWSQPTVTVWGKRGPTPRLQYSAGDEGASPYVYSGTQLDMNDWNSDDVAVDMLRCIRDQIIRDQTLYSQVCDNYNFVPNSCLVNYYRNGDDNVGYHSDKHEKDPWDSVITISLGCSRKFRFRYKTNHKRTVSVTLNSGDLILMCGTTQKLWEHQIPKVSVNKCNTGRISLTYRQV